MVHDIERIYNDGSTKNFKLLGVMFDEYLSFEDHIINLCTKISKSLFCINRIKNFINQETKKTLYFAMIHSHLVYCINIYSCATDTCLNKLRIKQKEAITPIRIICNAGYRDHTAPLFAQLKILPLSQLIFLSLSDKCGCPTETVIQIAFCVMQTTFLFRNITMPALKECHYSIFLEYGTLRAMKSTTRSNIVT